MARPSKFTPDRRKAILEKLESGVSREKELTGVDMSITVTVRRAKPDDAQDFAILHRHTWLRDVRDGEAVRRLLDKGNHVGHVAVEASGVVGDNEDFATFDSQVTRR